MVGSTNQWYKCVCMCACTHTHTHTRYVWSLTRVLHLHMTCKYMNYLTLSFVYYICLWNYLSALPLCLYFLSCFLSPFSIYFSHSIGTLPKKKQIPPPPPVRKSSKLTTVSHIPAQQIEANNSDPVTDSVQERATNFHGQVSREHDLLGQVSKCSPKDSHLMAATSGSQNANFQTTFWNYGWTQPFIVLVELEWIRLTVASQLLKR